jgi:hypothetical protein
VAARDTTNPDLLNVKLRRRTGYASYNTSKYTLPTLTGDSANVKPNRLGSSTA